MKFLIVFAVAMMSGAVFSQTCQVQMISKNPRQLVRLFTTYNDPSCLEGMKECRKSIRLDYSNNPQYPNGALDCEIANNRNPNPNPYPTPTDGLNVGVRVSYIPDNSLGTITNVDHYYNSVCVKFDVPRYDGAIDRCDIEAGKVRITNVPNPLDYLRAGDRVAYTPDNTYGYLTSIDYHNNSVCIKFDRPRYDGAMERCGIVSQYVRQTNAEDPTRYLNTGDRVFYTPDNTLGFLTYIDRYNNTGCIKFDRPRYDGAMERCNVELALIRRAY